jgi:hypothetical protein
MLSTQQEDDGPNPIARGIPPKPDPRLRAGREGERVAREALTNLPTLFRAYANVEIPNPRNRAGHNEADIVIAGPNALFVLEVKHHRGTVFGGEHDPRWRVTHPECGVTSAAEPTRNAVAQVKKLVWLMRDVFEAHGHRAWIQGIVVFSHPSVELCIDRMNTPCLRLDALVPFIRAYTPRGGCGRGTVALMERLTRESTDGRRLAA